jgi:hypothetical protein
MSRADHFWAKVRRGGPDDCWEWAGARNPLGYGNFWGGSGHARAHRFAFELENGPIPAGLCVLHRCDNTSCVNPGHLFLGTMKDNTADMVAKGRARGGVSGERNGKARLTVEAVIEIRSRRAVSARALAERFGVHRHTIHAIRRGQFWKEVDARKGGGPAEADPQGMVLVGPIDRRIPEGTARVR